MQGKWSPLHYLSNSVLNLLPSQGQNLLESVANLSSLPKSGTYQAVSKPRLIHVPGERTLVLLPQKQDLYLHS